MCHLAAYIGDRPIAPLLLRAVELQEPYSAGQATGLGVIDDGIIQIRKDFGHVARVRSTTDIESLEGTTGIAHSRYSGKLMRDPRHNTGEKAHPFIDDTGTIALMHNGDFDNYRELWEGLKGKHTFRSYSEDVDDITDSEVTVHMLSDAVAGGMSIEEGLRWMTPQLKGTSLLACMTTEQPETVWIANWHQRCVLALGDDEAMFSSSPIGFHEVRDKMDRVFEPPKNSLLKITRGRVDISPLDPSRKVPNLKLDKNKLGQRILEVLPRGVELDYKVLERALNKDGLAQALGISQERWEEYKKEGVTIVNPYIETLDMLIADGFINERIDLRAEGGVPDTPRFSYSLA
jgi:glucosamine 6-phosphate synthetase-like amidotransferase/phosphosugar isomerase protein